MPPVFEHRGHPDQNKKYIYGPDLLSEAKHNFVDVY